MSAIVNTVWRARLCGYEGDTYELHHSRSSADYAVAQHKKAAGFWGRHSDVDEVEVVCSLCRETCHCENDE